jgi:hypothetical protein
MFNITRSFGSAIVIGGLVCLLMGSAQADCLSPPGDLTSDGVTDVMDVQCTILTLLWELGGGAGDGPMCLGVGAWNADLDCDQNTTVTDAVLVIQAALDIPWSVVIDADGDLCADDCTLVLAGQLLGDGFVLGSDDGSLVLDQTIGTPRFVNTSTDGVYILKPGLP